MTTVPQSRFPRCSLCDEPLDLRTAKTDADGNAIHEECYVLSLNGAMFPPPPDNPSNGTR
jgi:hypothetical protein